MPLNVECILRKESLGDFIVVRLRVHCSDLGIPPLAMREGAVRVGAACVHAARVCAALLYNWQQGCLHRHHHKHMRNALCWNVPWATALLGDRSFSATL